MIELEVERVRKRVERELIVFYICYVYLVVDRYGEILEF